MPPDSLLLSNQKHKILILILFQGNCQGNQMIAPCQGFSDPKKESYFNPLNKSLRLLTVNWKLTGIKGLG